MCEVNKSASGISQAVVKAGGQAAMAETLGVSQQSISKWVRAGFAPVARAVEIEAQFGVPRAALVKPQLAQLFDVEV